MHKIQHSEKMLYGNERVEFRVSKDELLGRFLKHNPKTNCDCDDQAIHKGVRK